MMTRTSNQEQAVSQTEQIVKPHLEIDVEHLTERTSRFTQALVAFLSSNLNDPTGLKVSNLLLMVQLLRMDYAQINGLLTLLEQEKSRAF